MTQEQHEQFTKACLWFGEQLEKIFSPGSPTIERQDRGFVDKDGTWTVTNNCKVEIEKGWEILELKDSTNADYDLLLFEPGNYITRDKQLTYRLDHVLDFVKTKQWTIHSVRRLPDNSVWTIGDSVCHAAIEGKTGIYKFEINESVMLAYAGRWKSSIEFISRPENKPLFTTADGVQVFDKAQTVYALFWPSGTINEIGAGLVLAEWMVYSTREAAVKAYETWFFSQPVLTLAEVCKWMDEGPNTAFNFLYDLVKDKIAKR